MHMHIHQVYVVYYSLVDETCMLIVDTNKCTIRVSNVKYSVLRVFPILFKLDLQQQFEYTNGVIRSS
jgi:hypothetical protein